MKPAWHLAAPLLWQDIPERIGCGDHTHQASIFIDDWYGNKAVACDDARHLFGVREQLYRDRLVFHQLTHLGAWAGKDQVAQRHLAKQMALCIHHVDGKGNVGIWL